MNASLPKPECPYGYTRAQVEQIMGDRVQDFWRWMKGQTVSLCDGREYDYERQAYVDTGHCHGTIVYASDVRNFLAGGRAFD